MGYLGVYNYSLGFTFCFTGGVPLIDIKRLCNVMRFQMKPYLQTRAFTKNLISYYSDKYPLYGVEVGVQNGFNARNLLDNLNLMQLYLIDLDLSQAKKYLKNYNSVCTYYEGKSSDMIHELPYELDFGYIDGSHEKFFVKQDIEHLWKHIKLGGVIGGHDMTFDHRGVIDAVLEFTEAHGLIWECGGSDWWIHKI